MQPPRTSERSGASGKDIVCFTHTGKPLKAKTIGQKDYVNAIANNDIVFGIGPAGTGKTYLAVAMAVAAFKKKQVEKIILARPAVEAGESLAEIHATTPEKAAEAAEQLLACYRFSDTPVERPAIIKEIIR